MFDNSDSKSNAKAPDYVCKDRDCLDPESGYRTGVWASDTERNAVQAGAPPAATQAERTLVLDPLLAACIDAASEIVEKKFGKLGETATEADYTERQGNILTAAVALFEARSRHSKGILKLEKQTLAEKQKKAAEEAAERKRREDEERQRAQSTTSGGAGVDDDLPF